jgi:hypothetical protein
LAIPTPCTSKANQVGSPASLTAGAGNTSSARSTVVTPSSTGYWCFGAYYSGDSNYEGSSDTSTDECFSVGAAATTTSSLPASSRIAIGGSNSDNVTVSGNSAGSAPSGTVSFYECGPTASAAPCTSKANQVGATVTLSPGPGDVSYASSASFVFNCEGTYCFAAYYSGSSNYNASSDTTVTECFVVGAAPTITKFTPTDGPPGTVVTVKGTNLTGAAKVTLNGTSVTVTSNTATKIKFTVPVGAKSGVIKIVTLAGSVASATKFTVT